MKYYHCSWCDKRIELKFKKSHIKLELHMNTEWTVINKYTTLNPELCGMNNKLKNNVSNYVKRFVLYKN